ncbi:malonate decarboxylase subunit epsilon [Bradyrhizobium sacchari]|uniref:[acyl-carrier-protein] S-malonyltransferase n=1 Tax=Bradyrhizobium sacchari TaxID=1399419 RepID=A0A560JWN3_9BRAD|nr:acyltransferase domain-containing protein [Bradyrhizobium sacchari]OPY98768.1 malonate decarboxylase subunit epsilon [Bradyrhizobium sacchari]TWB60226.1 [acyl-carrier-protein] S-malonyltransferase [Bradyrhizobium sacchari]TWB73964.1 [acyl-carrier-protein] S-malonyltransferase [Bradyrhizobium sacchari]
MTLAILCSGQGRQHRNMFALTGDAPEAARLFVHAATLLGGRDPRDFVRSEADEALHRNRAGQILCTLQPLAAASALADALSRDVIIAGYSVGEVAAWGVGGLFDATATLDLVARRAEAMDAATHAGDGLIFVRGLAREELERLCVRHGAAIAIVNPGEAFVIGGGREALRGIAGDARAMHAARVVALPVEVASHTGRLAEASSAFREVLRATQVIFPPRAGVRILSGIDAAPVVSAGSGLDKLAAQISHTVQWADCLQACVEAGATGFLELGPGHALSGMAAEIAPTLPARSLDDFRSLQGIRAWIARHLDG